MTGTKLSPSQVDVARTKTGVMYHWSPQNDETFCGRVVATYVPFGEYLDDTKGEMCRTCVKRYLARVDEITEKNGYQAKRQASGDYEIHHNGEQVGYLFPYGNGWQASRSSEVGGREYAFGATAREVFEKIARVTWREQFNLISEKIAIKALDAGFLGNTTAWLSLVSAGENASMTDGITECTEEYYEATVGGFHSLMDEYYEYTVKYGDDYPYTHNIDSDLEDGKIEAP
jgi:hypothetical protein